LAFVETRFRLQFLPLSEASWFLISRFGLHPNDLRRNRFRTPKTCQDFDRGGSFPRIASGKVREIFDLGDAPLLVATDRLSAFDVILSDGIPGKGIVLSQMSHWWFARTGEITANHLLPDQEGEFARRGITDRDLQLRSMIVRKLKPLAIECVVRGYLVGSGWSSYLKNGQVCGHTLPPGLRQADRLSSPLFTPTTKAPKGEHDAPVDDVQGAAIVGEALYAQVKPPASRFTHLATSGRVRPA